MTLVELVICIAIVGVMARVGTPAVFRMLAYFRHQAFFAALESDLMRARSLAMTMSNEEDGHRVYYGLDIQSPWSYRVVAWLLDDPDGELVAPGDDDALARPVGETVNLLEFGELEIISGSDEGWPGESYIRVPARIVYNFLGQPSLDGRTTPMFPNKILFDLDDGSTGEVEISPVTGLPRSMW